MHCNECINESLAITVSVFTAWLSWQGGCSNCIVVQRAAAIKCNQHKSLCLHNLHAVHIQFVFINIYTCMFIY